MKNKKRAITYLIISIMSSILVLLTRINELKSALDILALLGLVAVYSVGNILIYSWLNFVVTNRGKEIIEMISYLLSTLGVLIYLGLFIASLILRWGNELEGLVFFLVLGLDLLLDSHMYIDENIISLRKKIFEIDKIGTMESRKSILGLNIINISLVESGKPIIITMKASSLKRFRSLIGR